jgi:TRAP-type C4-dicarboxylate transport system permease small subunit
MAGAIVTSREDEHIKMGFLRNYLRTDKHLQIHDFIVTVVTFVFLCFFAFWSYKYLSFSVERDLRSIVTNIPMAPVHASFFIGITLSVLHFVLHLFRKATNLSNCIRGQTE